MTIKRFLLALFLVLGASSISAQEICSNGVDDDGDGLIDLNDIVDCPCLLSGSIGEVTSLIPNASFETLSTCPNMPGQIFNATGWNAMTSGSPDYFNTCDGFSAIVPAPFPDGDGVAGFGASNGFSK